MIYRILIHFLYEKCYPFLHHLRGDLYLTKERTGWQSRMLSSNRADFNYTLMDDEKKALACIEKIERQQETKKTRAVGRRS